MTTANHRTLQTKTDRSWAAVLTSIFFVVAVVVVVIVGSLALNENGVGVPAWIEQEDAHCVRAARYANYALASLPIGSPPRILSLLVRFDSVVDGHAATIFSDELLRSSTLHCDESRNCTDTALLTEDSHGSQQKAVVLFRYGNPWSGEWTLEKQLSADGVFSLRDGYEYELSRTHLCWRPDANTTAGMAGFDVYDVHMESDHLVLDTADAQTGALANAPATACNGSVRLFPRGATQERTWLSLSSVFLFEASTSTLDMRRTLVEQGLGCAGQSSELEIYKLDCDLDVFSECRDEPSLPFRRVSQFETRLILRGNASLLGLKHRAALSRLSGTNSISEGALFATIRLVVLLIVAFVVFNRADRVSSSAFSTIKSALLVAEGSEKRSFATIFDMASDAAIGILAIVSRSLVLWHQAAVFSDDGHVDAVVFEIVGITVSFSHFCLRNLVLKVDLDKEPPLSKLGGSMSLSDASVAALMSVVSTPTLSAAVQNYDAVSRLFCGMLLALFVLHRLLFSVTACALMASTTASSPRFDRSYSALLWVSTGLWLVQAASVVFAFSKFFVIAQAFSLARLDVGPTREVESVVLLGSLALSTPYINSVSVRLSKW